MNAVSPDLDRRFRDAAADEGLLDAAYDFVDSPVGPLLVATSKRGVCRISYDAEPERELDRSRASHRAAMAAARRRNLELDRLGRELATLRRRRSVRLALASTAVLRRLVISLRGIVRIPRRAMRLVRRGLGQRRLRASTEAERALIATLSTDRDASTPERGPLVSIVILNRDGREHLERCLRAHRHDGLSRYRDHPR